MSFVSAAPLAQRRPEATLRPGAHPISPQFLATRACGHAAVTGVVRSKSIFLAGSLPVSASFRGRAPQPPRLCIEAKKGGMSADFDDSEWDSEKGLGTELTTGTWADGIEALERQMRIDAESKGAGRVVSSMKLTRQDLLQPGAVLTFHKVTTQVDVGVEDLGPPTTPVVVDLEVQKVRADWFARGEVRTLVNLVCDRCACDYKESIEAPWTMWITTKADLEELPDDEDAVMVMGPNVDAIDISGVVRDTVYSSVPSRCLCKQDCKGLCQRCGADLNAGECGCGGDEPGPEDVPLQWAGLAELVKSGALDAAFKDKGGKGRGQGLSKGLAKGGPKAGAPPSTPEPSASSEAPKRRGRPRKRPLTPGNPDLN
eukprot:tig00000178_g12816.t1